MILAILALIVTPLVMNIIKKARISADKRSIDAYGRSIEIAIATYLLDEGKFPSSINELNIEYSGDEVACSTTQLNSDSSVYLTGCRVAGRNVDYKYGRDLTPPIVTYIAYSIGDRITYKGEYYRVIKDADEMDANVTVLKEEPLTIEQLRNYFSLLGFDKREGDSNVTAVFDFEGYGGMRFGENSNYASSDIKQIVDTWAEKNLTSNDLVSDETGYSARLIKVEEVRQIGYDWKPYCPTCENTWIKKSDIPSWLFDSNYAYWTMSAVNDSDRVYQGRENGLSDYDAMYCSPYGPSFAVRPVITIKKSALQ